MFDDIRSTLDEVMVIWNGLIEHRQLDCDENNLLKIDMMTHHMTLTR